MDPNKALDEIRELCAQNQSADLSSGEVDRVLERVEALDEWLRNGGFLPMSWQKG